MSESADLRGLRTRGAPRDLELDLLVLLEVLEACALDLREVHAYVRAFRLRRDGTRGDLLSDGAFGLPGRSGVLARAFDWMVRHVGVDERRGGHG